VGEEMDSFGVEVVGEEERADRRLRYLVNHVITLTLSHALAQFITMFMKLNHRALS
jgi:hypothetical protein